MIRIGQRSNNFLYNFGPSERENCRGEKLVGKVSV